MHTIKELQDKVKDLFENRNYLDKPNELYEPIQYSLSQGGKRLRPLLSLFSCSLFGGDLREVENSAIGLEIFHNFTLLHDDIMDQSALRRGMSTVYKKWDTNTAILSGDTMFVIAYQYVTNTNLDILVDTLKVFNQTAKEVCEGQQYDMNFEEETNTSIEDYMEMIRLKTAVLIAAALKIGAISARATVKDCDLIYDFGIMIGLAFQLRDDFLDAFGDVDVFGKPIGNDIITNKKTYLYLKAYEIASVEMKENLNNAFALEGAIKVKKVLELYEELGIREATEIKIERLHDDAMRLLSETSIKEENKSELYLFLNQLIKREV
ncbi:MAG: polyprenyl synthetase family protein [Bacteroidetes bacterium]|nr:MAG: polyprenyl synthetase family protein [Bacteroidota bacterium]